MSAELTNETTEGTPKSPTAIRFLKFTAFSLGAGIIQLAAFTLLNEIARLEYWLSYFIALVLSVLYNFTANRHYTFKSAKNLPIAMLLVFLFYCAFTPYSIWLTDFLAKTHAWNEYLVLVLVMIQNLTLEFLWCRYVIYNKSMDTKIKSHEHAQTTVSSKD